MKVDERLLDYLLNLAHLPRLAEDHRQRLKKELSHILEYVGQLKEVPTEGVELLQRPYPLKNIGHEDEVKKSTLGPEVLPAEKRKDDYLIVAGLIDKEKKE